MKRRLLRLLTALMLVLSLCASLGVTAAADTGDVFTVTVKSGDNIVTICEAAGIDIYTYINIVKTLNGFTSDSQLVNLTAGQVLYLPTSNKAAAELTEAFAATEAANKAAAATTTTTTSTSKTTTVYPSYWSTVSVPTTSTTTTSGGTLSTGDSIGYYIVKYSVSSGDTMTGIYSSWGLNYKTYSNTILKLNKLTSLDSLRVGQTLYLPTNSATAGNIVYTVVAHKIQSGETVSGICSSYGLSYYSSTNMLETLNPGTNFNSIRAGSYLYIGLSGAYTA